MRNSIGEVFSWWRWPYVAWADKELAGLLWRLVGTLTNLRWAELDFSENSKTAQQYLEHYELVRRVCPPERLLEFELGSGWEPLCEFLGTKVPDAPYPNTNDKEVFLAVHRSILNRATMRAIQTMLWLALPVGIITGVVAWFLQRLV